MRTISNFHTHTRLCKHGEGTPLEYALQAQKEGCSALGFSDHCPYPKSFNEDYKFMRMDLEEIPLYKAMVQEARDAVSFPVYTGYECEFDPSYKSWYEELLGTHKADYLILGPHYLSEGTAHIGTFDLDSPQKYIKYVDQIIQGLSTGLFSFLAHPDLMMAKRQVWDENSHSYMKAILDAAVDLKIPLEINGAGIGREPSDTPAGMRYAYPYVEFWEMVKDTECRVVCNSDAHRPKDVIMNAWKARDFAGRFGITPIDPIIH